MSIPTIADALEVSKNQLMQWEQSNEVEELLDLRFRHFFASNTTVLVLPDTISSHLDCVDEISEVKIAWEEEKDDYSLVAA